MVIRKCCCLFEGPNPDERELKKVFSKYGPVMEAWAARNPICFVFIKFNYKDDGETAIWMAAG